MLLLDLSVCQFSLSAPMSVADSPTQLCFGARLNSCVRGAVIGNVAVCAAFVVALLLLGWWLEGTWRTTLKAVRRNVALPGMLILPYLLLLQPTAAASITLLRHRQDESDVWIGAFGVVVCLLVFLFFPLRVLPNFAHAAVPVDLSSKSRLMQWIAPQYEWVPIRTESDYNTLSAQRADGSAATAAPWVPELAATDSGQKFATFTSSYIVLFDAYSPGRHWFFVVEMLNAGINGIIGGIKPISDVGCQGLAFGMLAVTLVGVLLAVLKPYNSRIGTLSYVVQSVLGASSALCVVMEQQTLGEVFAVAVFASSIGLSGVGLMGKAQTAVRDIYDRVALRWRSGTNTGHSSAHQVVFPLGSFSRMQLLPSLRQLLKESDMDKEVLLSLASLVAAACRQRQSFNHQPSFLWTAKRRDVGKAAAQDNDDCID